MHAFRPQTSVPQVLKFTAQANKLFLLHIHVCLQSRDVRSSALQVHRSTGPQVHRSTGPKHMPTNYSYFIYMHAFRPETSVPQVLKFTAQANKLFLLHIHVCLQSTDLRSSGPQVHRSSGPLVYKSTGPQVNSSTGPQFNSTGRQVILTSYTCVPLVHRPQVHRSTFPQVHKFTAQANKSFLLHLHVCLQSTNLRSSGPQVHRFTFPQVHKFTAQANKLFLLHLHVCLSVHRSQVLKSTAPQVLRSTGPQHRPTNYSYFIYMYTFSPQISGP